MKKVIRKISISVFLIVMMITSVYATDSSANMTNSKSATDLDSNFTTKITLHLNKEREIMKQMDIVFVVDVAIVNGNMGNNLLEEVYALIDDINQEKNIKANIAMVGFGFGATKLMEFTDSKTITSKTMLQNKIAESSNWISTNKTGTNIESGLLLANSMLDSTDSGSTPDNRHMILLTDGAAFTYDNREHETSSAVYGIGGGVYLSMGNMDSNGDVGSASRETKMVKYYNETHDYGTAFYKLMEEGSAIDEKASQGVKFGGATKEKVEALVSEGKLTVYTSVSQVNNLESYPYTSLEIGTYRAAKVMKEMYEKNYNLYTIGYLYEYGFNNDGTPSNRLLGYPSLGFLSWTKNVGQLYLHNEKNIATVAFDDTFEEIDSTILETIQEESYIVDEIGFGNYTDGSEYEFDFINELSKINIKVGGTSLDKRKIDDNSYGFGKDDSLTHGYKFILHYYPTGIGGVTGNECLKLDINYTLDAQIPVDIEYQEVLKEDTRKPNVEITSEEILKAGNQSILYLRNGQELEFNEPTVSLKSAYQTNPNTGTSILKYILPILLGFSLVPMVNKGFLKDNK